MKLILFTGSWCVPCRKMKPLVKEVAGQFRIPLKLIDVEVEPDMANKYSVRAIPTLILLNNDDEVLDRKSGTMLKAQVEEFICKECF